MGLNYCSMRVSDIRIHTMHCTRLRLIYWVNGMVCHLCQNLLMSVGVVLLVL